MAELVIPGKMVFGLIGTFGVAVQETVGRKK